VTVRPYRYTGSFVFAAGNAHAASDDAVGVCRRSGRAAAGEYHFIYDHLLGQLPDDVEFMSFRTFLRRAHWRAPREIPGA
jgi:hypothetical protein